LAIESSDIDISVKYAEGLEDVTLMMTKVVNAFKKTGNIETITPIFTASVPVIKIVHITLL
jgi:DNA polymerase sigma